MGKSVVNNVDFTLAVRDALRKEMGQFRNDIGGSGDHTGGNPPGGNGLEKRVEALEKSVQDARERLIRIEGKAESIEKHGATKADLASLESTLIKWFVGTAFAMVGLATAIGFGLARLLK